MKNIKQLGSICALTLALATPGCAIIGNTISGAVVTPVNTFQKARETASKDNSQRKWFIYAMIPIAVPVSIPLGLILGAVDGIESDVYALMHGGTYQEGRAPGQCSYYLGLGD